MEYSIILPCYEEAENLRVLLPQIKQVMQKLSNHFEILVIDKNIFCPLVASLCEKHGAIYFNRHPENDYGDAFRTGVKVSQSEYIIFMDSDGSHPPAFLEKMITTQKNNAAADLVIASRYIKGGASKNNTLLVFMSKLVNLFYSKILHLKCHDVSNSFRLYRKEKLLNIELSCKHFDVIEEVLFKLLRNFPQLRLIEIPFTFQKRLHGTSRRKFIIFLANYFLTLAKLWRLPDNKNGLS
ncbi:MAG: glycosyltransferase [Gammaproteobacteria bacterium]|nr:glycosyltransferase [Gammaproteobacteria bacterium]